MFSTNLPPAVAGALIEAVKLLNESDEATMAVWRNGNYFKAKMKEAGFDIGHSETPITPVFFKDEALTVSFSKHLLEEGVFVSPIIFPTVPKGLARVRVMVTTMHTAEQLDKAVAAFVKVRSLLTK